MRSLTILALSLFVATGAAAAETFDRVHGIELAKALQDLGFRAKLDRDTSGDPVVQTAMAGLDVSVLTDVCEGTNGCGMFMCTSYILVGSAGTENPKVTPEAVNRWNAENYFGQAYIDSDNDLAITLSFNVMGGVTQDYLKESLDWCEIVLNRFNAEFSN